MYYQHIKDSTQRATRSRLTNGTQTWKHGLRLPSAHGETSRAIWHAWAWRLLCGPNWRLLMLDCLARWSSDVVVATTIIVVLIVLVVLILLVILVVIVLLVTAATPSATTATSWNFLVGEVVVELYKKDIWCQKVYNQYVQEA
jgi:hypothetical protein